MGHSSLGFHPVFSAFKCLWGVRATMSNLQCLCIHTFSIDLVAWNSRLKSSCEPSRVQIKLNHKTKQNNSVMTALQKILYQRFYVFPKSTQCFWEENVYVFICPLWHPDLNWAFAEHWRLTASGVDYTWRWLMLSWMQADFNNLHQ